jgi:hypothetical protein
MTWRVLNLCLVATVKPNVPNSSVTCIAVEILLSLRDSAIVFVIDCFKYAVMNASVGVLLKGKQREKKWC